MRLARYTLGAACLALAGASLQAAPPKAREGTLGGGRGSGPIMSMAQLRTCVAQQARIQGEGEELARLQQQLATDRAEIDRSAVTLKDGLAALDRSNKEAVEAYVAQAKAHDAVIDAYEARVPAFNSRVQALQAERSGYGQVCENRRYLEDDLKDIKAGK